MQMRGWALTMGIGAAVGAVAVMLLPRESTARKLVNKAASAVEDIAQNGHIHALEVPPFFADGEKVKQSLRRMFMGSVTGVDHAAFEVLCDEILCAGG